MCFFSTHETGLNCGEVTQPFLLQQLGNPGASPRDRETLLAVLNYVNQPQLPEPLPNVVHPQMTSPNIIAQQSNAPNNPIPPPPGAPINHELLQSQHLFLQHQANVAAQKQQLRISPLPNSKLFSVQSCIELMSIF